MGERQPDPSPGALMRYSVHRGAQTWVTLLCGWFLFYWLTAPTVHVEADDAYQYAYDVEAASFSQLLHPYHPLYLVLMRVLFVIGKSIGLVDRSFPLMLVAGAALAAGAVTVFSLVLWKHLGVPKRSAIVAGGVLGFSYGFWRYAAEAETYALASLLALGLVWLTLGQSISTRRAAFGGLLGVLAVLSHVLNVIPALVSAPLYMALRTGRKQVVAYLTVFVFACLPVGYGVWSAARVEYPHYTATQSVAGEIVPSLGTKDISIATVVLGHVVASGNFLFVFPAYRSWISEEFPAQRLEGEKLIGLRAWPPTGVVGFVTVLIAVVAFAWTLWMAGVRRSREFRGSFVLAMLSWLALYLATISYLGTLEQPEAWLLALVPFWLLFGWYAYHELPLERNVMLIVFLPAALLVHNAIGGMAMLKSPESDRHRLKAEWLLENAGEKDVILTTESSGFSRYLRYYSMAEIVPLRHRTEVEVTQLYDTVRRAPGRVFVTGEVVDPPIFIQRSPEPWMSDSVIELLRRSTKRVHDDAWGGVFLVRDPAPSE